MIRLRYSFDTAADGTTTWARWHEQGSEVDFNTNLGGNGVFCGEHQLVGTWDFTVRGLTPQGARSRIRRWYLSYFAHEIEQAEWEAAHSR